MVVFSSLAFNLLKEEEVFGCNNFFFCLLVITEASDDSDVDISDCE